MRNFFPARLAVAVTLLALPSCVIYFDGDGHDDPSNADSPDARESSHHGTSPDAAAGAPADAMTTTTPAIDAAPDGNTSPFSWTQFSGGILDGQDFSLAYDDASQQIVGVGIMYGDDGNYSYYWASFDGTSWTTQPADENLWNLEGNFLAYDGATNQLVYAGTVPDVGLGTTQFNDTWWSADGATWQPPTSENSPQGGGIAMAYDALDSELVLFGGSYTYENDGDPTNGYIDTDNYDQTMVWNGSTWITLTPANSPSARGGAAMAFDSVHSQVVMFGGGDNTKNFAETWVWDGTTWTQLHPVNSPPARCGAAMAFDPNRGQIVLFGGTVADSSYLGDTWIWDGNNWSQEIEKQSPSPRMYANLMFDSALGKLVLYGGYNSDMSSPTETWWLP